MSLIINRRNIVSSAGGFVPTDLSDCVGWWDFSNISSLTLSGSEITNCRDLSSVSRDLIKGSAGPESIINGKNGLNIASFIRSNETVLYNNDALTYSQPTTFFFVFNWTWVNQTEVLLDGYNVLANRQFIATVNTTFRTFAGTSINNILSFDGWYVAYVLFNGINSQLQLNSFTDTNNPGGNAITDIIFGSYYLNDRPDLCFNGDLGEVIMYNGDKSTDKDTVMSYLSEKWDINIL